MCIRDSNKIDLTYKESLLLELLIENKNKFIPMSEISFSVWNEVVSDNTIAVLVKRLRQKLGKKDLIVSKREVGYKLNVI
jgi:DNA-binding response OmpR family regulator